METIYHGKPAVRKGFTCCGAANTQVDPREDIQMRKYLPRPFGAAAKNN